MKNLKRKALIGVLLVSFLSNTLASANDNLQRCDYYIKKAGKALDKAIDYSGISNMEYSMCYYLKASISYHISAKEICPAIFQEGINVAIAHGKTTDRKLCSKY